jgi:uncharacterized protein (DUF4213/DUF364 family)
MLRDYLKKLIEERGWGGDRVTVRARTLTPEEAIGSPEDDDYPLVRGRERLIEADFRGARGQAFTDMSGDFEGTLEEIAGMEAANNFRRAVFIATLNAVMRHAGRAERTVHCRDEEPVRCARELPDRLAREGPVQKVALVGLQPRMLESLSRRFEVRTTDMDAGNIGRSRAGVVIEATERAAEHIAWCDAAVVTGTTVANGTIERFLDTGKTTVFFGVTCAGAAAVLGLDRFCPRGR